MVIGGYRRECQAVPEFPVDGCRYARGGDGGVAVPVKAALVRVAVRIPVTETVRADHLVERFRAGVETVGIGIVRSQGHPVVEIISAIGSRGELGRLVLPAAYLSAVVGIMGLDQGFNVIGGCHQQLDAPGLGVGLVEITRGRTPQRVDAVKDVIHVATVLVGCEGNPRGHIFTDGAVHHALGLEGAVGLHAGFQVGGKFPCGFPGNEMYQAAGGVAAEQGALRPAQHFRPVHVEILQVQAADRGAVDVVEVNSDGVFVKIGYFVQAYTPQEKVDLTAFGVGHRVLQAGGHGREINGIGQTQFLDLLAGVSGHRDADVLQVLFALLRGNDYFFQDLCACVDRNDQRQGQNHAEKRMVKRSH